ncbi:hypothetical protein H2198_000728 [Neophaeococcomyces mojaviensis]|uniref:Uncharacterized protein n=1 Tax=Neophaeococcomyces mojaviensis TaxID=3383035 RepID=A0ACC3AJ86_9EURO|nr:hypothetical protein H2198_000728 [Knufia sp. JES_112]
MKSIAAVLLLLPMLIAADVTIQTVSPPLITPAPTSIPALSERVPTISSIPSTFIPFTSQTHAWDPIISGANYVLDELNEHLHVDLKKRQGGAGVTNVVPATTVITQMPSITKYQIHGQGPVFTYTQVFTPNPDPWPSPSAGTVGLGTIQGQVGVVKTQSKRTAIPEVTGASGQVLRIKGRAVPQS